MARSPRNQSFAVRNSRRLSTAATLVLWGTRVGLGAKLRVPQRPGWRRGVVSLIQSVQLQTLANLPLCGHRMLVLPFGFPIKVCGHPERSEKDKSPTLPLANSNEESVPSGLSLRFAKRHPDPLSGEDDADLIAAPPSYAGRSHRRLTTNPQ